VRIGRVIAAVAGALASAAMALALLAPAAHAAAYRYWTYWTGDSGTWAFAVEGPATRIPADGSVDGWRFAVTTVAGSPGDAPRVAADFATICAGVTAPAGSKRVAVVIDAGPAAIAPDGEEPPPPSAQCVVLDEGATSADALSEVATVRTQGGLVCGLAGYPRDECAPAIPDAEASALTTSASAEPSPTAVAASPEPTGEAGSPLPTLGVLTVLAIGGAVVALVIRRRAS
jgi:hypothetical protein